METLYQGKFLTMVREGRWEYCERAGQTEAVMIFARTPEGKVLLVEEYRPPIGKRCLCFPAGLSGDEQPEAHVAAAHRELVEETGYAAESMRYLFTGPSSPGLTSETLHFFLAEGVHRVSAGGGVEGECISVCEAPADDIDAWLADKVREGAAIDPRVYTGLYFLNR